MHRTALAAEMPFKVAVVYFSLRGRLATLAHVIAEGAKTIPGAVVSVYRIQDPVVGDDPDKFDARVLAVPVATKEALVEHDCIIIGAPGRQGGFAGEVRLFLDSLAEFQEPLGGPSKLMGKVGGAFTSVGGQGRGFGGHEAILQQFHATFLQHGMVVVGVPPQQAMHTEAYATPFGVVMAGRFRSGGGRDGLHEGEVKLAYSQGAWAAQVTKHLHDSTPCNEALHAAPLLPSK